MAGISFEGTSLVALITGVGVAVLVMIMIGVMAGTTYNLAEPNINLVGSYTGWVAQEQFVMDNATGTALKNAYIRNVSFSNSTETILSANFTVNYATGVVLLLDGAGHRPVNGGAANVSYNYKNRTMEHQIKETALGGFQSLQQVGSFMPLIILAVVVSIVLGVVMGISALQRQHEGGGGAL